MKQLQKIWKSFHRSADFMPIAFCGAEIFKNLNAAEKNLIDFFSGKAPQKSLMKCCQNCAMSYCIMSTFPAMNIRVAAGVGATVMSAVFTSCCVPSMLKVNDAPSGRTSMVTGAPMTSGRLTSP